MPLAQEKPVYIKSIFQEEERFADILSLSRQLDNLLIDNSSVKNNPFIYFPVDEFPNAFQVLGRYNTTANGIKTTIKVIKTDTHEAVSSFTLTHNDAKVLAAAIVEKIKALK